jgi:hypothetical protein
MAMKVNWSRLVKPPALAIHLNEQSLPTFLISLAQTLVLRRHLHIGKCDVSRQLVH